MTTTGFPDSSVGKESTCNAGDPGWIPGLGRSTGVRDRLPTPIFLGFPCRSAGKESACNEEDLASIPGLGRCPRERKVYPLQYSGLDLQSLGLHWVGHNWATFTFTPRLWSKTVESLRPECQIALFQLTSTTSDFMLPWYMFAWCYESAALNMPANLENSAVAIRLKKVSFHSNPKERQCQRMLKLPHNCTHLTC